MQVMEAANVFPAMMARSRPGVEDDTGDNMVVGIARPNLMRVYLDFSSFPYLYRVGLLSFHHTSLLCPSLSLCLAC